MNGERRSNGVDQVRALTLTCIFGAGCAHFEEQGREARQRGTVYTRAVVEENTHFAESRTRHSFRRPTFAFDCLTPITLPLFQRDGMMEKELDLLVSLVSASVPPLSFLFSVFFSLLLALQWFSYFLVCTKGPEEGRPFADGLLELALIKNTQNGGKN